MTTSLTNTLLSKFLCEYAMQVVGISDFDYFVEGDDNYVAFNGPRSAVDLITR